MGTGACGGRGFREMTRGRGQQQLRAAILTCFHNFNTFPPIFKQAKSTQIRSTRNYAPCA